LGFFGRQPGQPVDRQRPQRRRSRPGGKRPGQARVGDGARGRRVHRPRTVAMVPAQRIACKAPKAKFFMKGRDFLHAIVGRTRHPGARDGQRQAQRHQLAAALDGDLAPPPIRNPPALARRPACCPRPAAARRGQRPAAPDGDAAHVGRRRAAARRPAWRRQAAVPCGDAPRHIAGHRTLPLLPRRPRSGSGRRRWPEWTARGRRPAPPRPVRPGGPVVEVVRERDGAPRERGGSRRDSRRRKGQFWTNCICVPARSMMSPCFSEIASSPTGWPLTLGRREPSTCDST